MAALQMKSISALLCLVVLAGLTVNAQRQDPQVPTKPKQVQNESITCGGVEDLAMKLEVCAKPLMDIMQGTIDKWPTNEKETADLCNSFNTAEKCIRDTGRKCAKGLHKTIVSTLANSISRARKRECAKSKLPMILKTTQCVERNLPAVHSMISNITAHLTVIETQVSDLDQRTNMVCCMVHEIESDIRKTFEPVCKEENATVIRLYRAVLEDVIELICRSPKCKEIFRGYKIPKPKPGPPTGIIAILMRIVFSLG